MIGIDTKTLKSLIPYGGFFLIFLGVLKLTVYYNAFNVSINHFLELSEVVTSFLNDLLFITYVILGTSLFDFLLTNDYDVERRNEFFNSYIGERKLLRRMKFAAFRFAPIISVNIVFILLLFFNNTYFIRTTLVFINLQTLLQFLLLEYRKKHLEFYKQPLSPSLYNSILYLIMVLILLLNNTYNEIHEVKESKKFIRTSFTTEKGVIKSDSTHYYIGQTKNFLFFYNEEKKMTTVFPISEIKQIDFGQ